MCIYIYESVPIFKIPCKLASILLASGIAGRSNLFLWQFQDKVRALEVNLEPPKQRRTCVVLCSKPHQQSLCSFSMAL